MKVGDKFRFFGFGQPCIVTSVQKDKIKFEFQSLNITGSFPVDMIALHMGKRPTKQRATM